MYRPFFTNHPTFSNKKYQEKGFDGGKQLWKRYGIYKTRL